MLAGEAALSSTSAVSKTNLRSRKGSAVPRLGQFQQQIFKKGFTGDDWVRTVMPLVMRARQADQYVSQFGRPEAL